VRAALHPALIPHALLRIAGALGAATPTAPLPPEAERLVASAGADLRTAHGRAILMVGRGQPAEAHALAAWINQRLGAPVDWIEPVDPDPTGHADSLRQLAGDMHGGRVRTLLVLDANPLFHAAPALGLEEAIRRVPLSIAFAAFPDETAMAATWRAPLAHPLESWGDLRATDGTASLVQPMVKPIFGGRSALSALDLIDPAAPRPGDYARVRGQWRADDRWWRDRLVAGVIEGTAASPVQPGVARLVQPRPGHAGAAMIVTLPPSSTLWDGRHATNAWAQECPDAITKQVWGTSLRLSAADAARLKLKDNDIVAFAGLKAPVRILKGQAEGVATLPLGWGRTAGGPVAVMPGANGFLLRDARGGFASAPLELRATGQRHDVPSAQAQFALDGALEDLFPVVTPGGVPPRREGKPPSLLGDGPPVPPQAPQWGMVIDTAVCIGCNACVVACQAENNVPSIGPEQIARGRDMHWLRVDRYEHEGGGGFQPVPCMQCETAPCEPVCPVEASVHDAQGLNNQVYNRCVGTRTCQANCPYKVRRFNFLDYAGANLWEGLDPDPVAAQRNPEVTVRSRGVMEKCTYCVQRIAAAEHEADATGAPVANPATACQAACPTRAITFGNLADPSADVAKARSDPRHYALLEELGTRPRTTYLARIVNPPEERGA
jgi:molybdopterin-containing oxidoreductase family iron-sulfur binding subunit